MGQAAKTGGARREWKYLKTAGIVKAGAACGWFTMVTGTSMEGTVVSVKGRLKSLIQPQANCISLSETGFDDVVCCLEACNQLCRYRPTPIFWLNTSMSSTVVTFVMIRFPVIGYKNREICNSITKNCLLIN